jgi:hypothetical protein
MLDIAPVMVLSVSLKTQLAQSAATHRRLCLRSIGKLIALFAEMAGIEGRA